MTGISTYLENLNRMIDLAGEFVWGLPMLTALIGTGMYLCIRLKLLPLRNLFGAIGLIARGGDTRRSSFQALSTELAATIGIGNIIGVAGAMIIGGPGALVWMIVSAIPGLATKLVESTLSVRYRVRDQNGEYLGGPMVTLKLAFPFKKMGRILSKIYCVLALLCAFGMGNMVQSNAIADALYMTLGVKKVLCALVVGFFTILAVGCAAKRISGICCILVPFMGAVYLLACLYIIAQNLQNLPEAMREILVGAFCPSAVCGGLFGTISYSTNRAVLSGVSRGVFSNEAGLGASGICAASSDADPIRQGYISMTGVFFDTILICLITGLTFACSGVYAEAQANQCILENGTQIIASDPAGLMIAVFEKSFGKAGSILLAICILLFAYATILGWAYQGEKVYLFLTKGKAANTYRLLYALSAFLGGLVSLKLVWSFADLCNGLLAVPNLICVLVMAPGICEEIKNYGLIRRK